MYGDNSTQSELKQVSNVKNVPVYDLNYEQIVINNSYFLLVTKRLFDIFFSILFGIITLPIMVLTALLIKLDSKGPIIYRQKRVGLNDQEFWIYKFRSMSQDAEANGAVWAQKKDPRVTTIGKFIRKTRIDELPQLYNVLKGEMSVIGPRPERGIFIEEFTKEIPLFSIRTKVKPGLTGWAQVKGGYELTPGEKLEQDIYYMENRNLRMEIIILLLTVKVVSSGSGAR
ncbi:MULTISPECIES: exopolysaccharide biosynthesis polyprenyl glycosylphosphotransferase [Priestia]|mgnify:CR=1 FL=1|uniref:exopolysaccharide biosynthesis polyprenyl glycosylphosphotransferase n=1 Tax=Priestia TaxID=2800373 RepID=UPI001BEC9860|nr:exopolysaccharide biosynthesis polyprenyl glycosylphosphotransferase [Priestia megaterium]MBT2259243.1 exopolysaccharide biosynthesis polyprenyl glycosylphosphotransferase [Priestia megaterium]